MTRIIGQTALVMALVLALAGAVAAVVGVRRRRPELVRSAQAAVWVNFALLSVANLAMVYALVTHDFSISYVAQVGSRSTPLLFTVISLWGALEGSILFWGWVLAAFTAVAVYRSRARLPDVLPYATATLLTIGAFFYLLLIGPADPFEPLWPVPADGPGPNPLLQNHILMAVHPPLLYLGYVGMAVPYAFAVGSLLSGRFDDVWIRATRRWTIVAWTFLTLAIVAGMWWSYEVLGWGGYWAWDPVENASFMPWLTATAFLHSVMVQERREMLRVWNLGLITATFVLTVLGTFLTRSGILSSVHAFTQGAIGYYFLVFIALVLVFSLVLVGGRSGELRSAGRIESMASRETAFLLNNLVLTAFTFTVLLGTLFPLVAEAVRGVKVSVGGPFFNRMTLPLCVTLLFLLGVGPALPWGRPSAALRRRFLVPLAGLLLAVAVAALRGAHQPYALLVFGFGAFAALSNMAEFAGAARARVRAHGEGPARALLRVIAAHRRRYGGYTAHLGVVALAVGIAASSSLRREREATLPAGGILEVAGYGLRLDRLWAEEEPQRFVIGSDVTLLEAGRERGRLEPRLNYYGGRSEPLTTPAVQSRATRDIYVTLMAFENDGSSATLKAVVEPLVAWIWVGGLMIALGAVIALWPGRRRTRRSVGVQRELPLQPAAAPRRRVAEGGAD
ncbi:MAG: heme lyase CcmF/NrfE family subunit [Gemmatimonadetes bacterium]|nr:heme lyase CcmF/NrfE family subunit [Gemmatimonadota bacterium]